MAVTYVTGDRRQVMVAVDSAVAFSKGDLLYLSSGKAYPLSNLSDSGTKAQNQAAAHDLFLGVASRSHASGSTAPVLVATRGVFEFDTASTTYEIGDLVGPDGTGAAGAVGVSNAIVAGVANGSLSIGRVFKRVPVAALRVQVEIVSNIMRAATDDTGSFDSISEVTSGSGVTLDPSSGTILAKDGSVTASVSVITSLLTEYTATAGVVADGVRLKDGRAFETVTVGSITSSTPTVTAANMAGGVIVATTQSTSTVTMDTGTALDTYFTSIVGTNIGFRWSIVNSNSGTMTITNNTAGNNLTGLNTLATNVVGQFFTYRTGTNAWATIRVA